LARRCVDHHVETRKADHRVERRDSLFEAHLKRISKVVEKEDTHPDLLVAATRGVQVTMPRTQGGSIHDPKIEYKSNHLRPDSISCAR
jgi:hypothetical protein